MATEQPHAKPAGVDAHCHLDDPRFDADRAEVIERARQAGIGRVVVPSSDPRRWGAVRAVAERFGSWFAVGVHPWFVDQPWTPAELTAASRGAHAIGETGLDYVSAQAGGERRRQREALDVHLQLAADTDRPVVLHAVRAVPDVLDAVEGSGVRAQLHGAVRGDLARAARAGLYLSFGPDLARSGSARRWIRELPRDRVLLETDGPHRPLATGAGEPADVAQLATLVAGLWTTDPSEVLAVTGANARRLFGEPP